MRRLRLTERSRQVVAVWTAGASPEHRRRAAELLRTLLDGSWDDRWYWQPTSATPEVVEIRIDRSVPVFVEIFRDEDDGMAEYADIFSIVNSAET